MKFVKAIIIASALSATPALAAGPFDALKQGMVGGDFKSTVKVDKITSENKGTGLGFAEQKVDIGSVNGGKAFGKVELNVDAKEIYSSNRAGLGYAKQEVSVGSLK
jgi:hypothetical protein